MDFVYTMENKINNIKILLGKYLEIEFLLNVLELKIIDINWLFLDQ